MGKFMKPVLLFLLSLLVLPAAGAQGTVPTFKASSHYGSYAIAGRDPAQGGTTVLPTVLVPVTLSFESSAVVLDAKADVPQLLRSPIFSSAPFPTGGTTQYGDALLRSTFDHAQSWHTLLGRPTVQPVRIAIPAGDGYILTSHKTGRSIAVVDVEYLQRELFHKLPRQEGKLVIAVTRNTTYYAFGDATICCSWGAHGVDAATGNSFVLSSYLDAAPAIVKENDVQPLTEQLAEFFFDPLHDSLSHTDFAAAPGNHFSSWRRPGEGDESCSGNGVGSNYFQLEPTDTNLKNNFPESKAYTLAAGGAVYHLQNVALLSWYANGAKGLASRFSFPNAQRLTAPAVACRASGAGEKTSITSQPTLTDTARSPHSHKLIGYWVGHDESDNLLPLRDISPQWDVIIVAFAAPDKHAPEGSLEFHLPPGIDTAQFKADIAYLKSRGKKVMISLGGGGQFFTLDDARSIPTFVSSVTNIVTGYGFDGIDIDFENPSLALAAGDDDFKHPTTPSVVNLITSLRQIQNHFGPEFMISLVPEGTQMPAGQRTYGGQFGSYLAITYALRDILSFVDVQDYNTPPLEGLDGEIYQSHTVDYHAAMTELLLHGFRVAGKGGWFPPMPANKIAVGFLVGYAEPTVVHGAMQYLITGKAPSGATYTLLRKSGYPDLSGAMFWTIDGDRLDNYSFSNLIGPQIHGFSSGK
jgi:chitinase